MIIGTLGNALANTLFTFVVAGLGPPIMILFWFLKSSIELASVKNSGLKDIFNALYFLLYFSVVPGGIVDFIAIFLL